MNHASLDSLLTLSTDMIPLRNTAILLAVAMVGIAALRYLYARENYIRQQKTWFWTPEGVAEETRSTVRRGDQRYTYKYTL